MAVKALLQTDMFAYLTNSRLADPWHAQRLDLVSNLVHTAIA